MNTRHLTCGIQHHIYRFRHQYQSRGSFSTIWQDSGIHYNVILDRAGHDRFCILKNLGKGCIASLQELVEIWNKSGKRMLISIHEIFIKLGKIISKYYLTVYIIIWSNTFSPRNCSHMLCLTNQSDKFLSKWISIRTLIPMK